MGEQRGAVTRFAPREPANGADLAHRQGYIPALSSKARIALVGNYAPRQCGIATFSTDLREKVREFEPDTEVDVYALEDASQNLDYRDVAATIAWDDPEAYRSAAAAIDASGVDAVWLQHEYGIFGGPDGEMVLDFVDRLATPLIVTLHTVLVDPSARQKTIIEHLARRASKVMVMSRHARDLLAEEYGVAHDRIALIEHGAPERPFGRQEAFKERLGLSGKTVLMTFGLLGPGKGLEHVIEALPAIVQQHPEVVYRIVGKTHPNLIARDGEAYREKLQQLANDLGISRHIEWDDRFLETEELLDQLEGCDIYLTPYPNMQQSTSGTLSYAVALGKPVVSTPYIHARELLAEEVGVLVEQNDPAAIADAVNELLDDPDRLGAMGRRAYRRGQRTVWPRFAAAAAALVREVIPSREPTRAALRRPNPAAIFALSDGTGLLQHSLGPVPDRRHGYCLDDNARALMLTMRMERSDQTDAAALTYASFIQHAWNEERGIFRNFMRFDRSWCEDAGSDDANGRAIWALGDCCARAHDPALRQWARRLYDTALPHMEAIDSPRALAFMVLGALGVLEQDPEHGASRDLVRRSCDMFCRLVEESRRPDRTWFEMMLAYDNPRLSEALIAAGTALDRFRWVEIGLDTLQWLAEHQYASEGHFRPVGSDSLGKSDLPPLPFDQQPLEALAAIEASSSAWRASGDDLWFDRARRAYDWFFGANDRGVALADPATGRCRDGLTPHGANENCGAESILAFHLSYHSMLALSRHAADKTGDTALAETVKGFAPGLAHS